MSFVLTLCCCKNKLKLIKFALKNKTKIRVFHASVSCGIADGWSSYLLCSTISMTTSSPIWPYSHCLIALAGHPLCQVTSTCCSLTWNILPPDLHMVSAPGSSCHRPCPQHGPLPPPALGFSLAWSPCAHGLCS